MIKDTRIAWVRDKKVKKLPCVVKLPDHFIKANNIQYNDVIQLYIARSGELIIKKKES